MDLRQTIFLLIRYSFLLILPLSGLFIFYFIFTPLTVYPSFWLIKFWYPDAIILGTNTIFFKGYYAEIIRACIAGAAYYLLVILNLTTPMHIKKRIASLLFVLITFLLLNITRIAISARLFDIGYNYFDLTHQLTWYFGSTFLIVVVWFAAVLIFKIQEIPIYTDVKMILKDIKIKQ